MPARADILDQTERLGKPLAGSLILHVSFAALVLTGGWITQHRAEQWGSLDGGGMGSVAVNVVARIPLPERSGATNPVANDTESAVPTPPPQPKTQTKAKEPDPDLDAIPIKSRNATKKAAVAASTPNKFRAQQKDMPNQVYSAVGQALVSPSIGLTGGGGVGIGTNSPFGTQFGYYADLLRNKVAQNWRTGDLDPRIRSAPEVIIEFTLQRDGSVVPGSVQIAQRSGNMALDYSAQRAILDASPFPPLPQGFTKSRADIQFVFQLRR
jgi:protein TonB